MTREKKEKDRTTLTYTQNANVGPIFISYEDDEEINKTIEEVVKANKPHIDIEFEDGMTHILWKCSQEQSARIEKLFEKVPELYIADGHHRSASAYNVGKMRREEALKAGKKIDGSEDFNYFMALMYAKKQLTIWDYNRVIKSLNGHSP